MRPVEAATEHRVGQTLELRDTFRPTPKQREFWGCCNLPYSVCEEVLFDGAIRGGKTQAGVKMIVAWAMKYGGTYVISRFSYRELEDSTKKVCLYGDGDLPPSIPPQLVRAKNETHNKVTLVNGSEILFRALEPRERGKVRNITAAGWLIDQAEELEGDDIDDFYQEIKGRCSLSRGPRKLVLIANPGPKEHILYRRFIDSVTRYGKGRRVHVTIHDNKTNIAHDYYLMLLATEHTNPSYFARMVMGEWGVQGGRRFKVFDPKLHVVDKVFDIPGGWEVIEGIDYGWANPTVVEWVAIDYTGRWWVVAEHHAVETAISVHSSIIKRVRHNHPDVQDMRPFEGELEPSASWLDPSAWAKKSEHESPAIEFLENEVYVAKAVNERLGGWNRIEEYLTKRMEDGYPRLRIFPTCDLLIRELPELRIKPGTDDVEKVRDHAADALRYAVMSRMPTPDEVSEEDEHSREAVVRRMLHGYERRERGGHVHEGG